MRLISRSSICINVILLMVCYQTISVMPVYDFPNDYNFFLSDITHYELITKISSALNIKYLRKSSYNFMKNTTGVAWGYGRRMFVSLPVRINNQKCKSSINVIFKVDTSTKNSTISRQVVDALYKQCGQIEKNYKQNYKLKINQIETNVVQTVLPLQLFNTLGVQYLFRNKINMTINYGNSQRRAFIYMEFQGNK